MSRLRNFPYSFEIIAVIGLALYVAQSWHYAYALDSIGDEGSYLYKGYMYARGDYRPFQDYAFWTNKMPLSFLIPGYIQHWFGPGLRVGRHFAMFVSLLMLTGIWITANRLAGKGWAALAVWVFALSDAVGLGYSQAVSQGLVACMMAWMFVLTLGEGRPLWQLIAGSALSMLMVMTRQNMAVVPALLAAYIFWQHGQKAGWWALATSGVIFVGFHAYYWPNILDIWVPYLPASLTPFLDYFRGYADSAPTFSGVSTSSRLQSFATGVHDHFFILCGSASALILFPKRADWNIPAHFKTAVFLGATFFLLFFMHAWASLPTAYCVYCFSGYQLFYNTAGLLFILVVLSNGISDTRLRRVALMISLLFFAGNLGLYYYQRWDDWLLNHLRILRVNRIFTSGLSTVSLGDILTYVFDLPLNIQRRAAPAAAGVLIGIILIALVYTAHRFFLEKKWGGRYSPAGVTLACFLFIGVVYAAGPVLPAPAQGCSTRFLPYYEEAGKSLADLVPANSLVYWRGSGRQLALMLYVNDVRIFPPLMHAGGGMSAGDTDRLFKSGRFDATLDKQWRESADIVMVWDQYFNKEFQQFVEQSGFEMLPYNMGKLTECEDALLVFGRGS